MNQLFFKELVKTFSSITSKKEMENFLYGILTPKEIDELSTRLQIVKMLKRKIPQHQIAQKLGVGIATVTRGSLEINKGRFTYV